MDAFLQKEWPPLMEACTKNLYRLNPFCVLGLAVSASVRQITRRIDELRIEIQTTTFKDDCNNFPSTNLLLTAEELNHAESRLQDPLKKFVDEFFWFWPLNWNDSENDPALQAWIHGDRSSAEAIWIEQLTGHTERDRLVGTHNLAVMFHYSAIEMEHRFLQKSPPLLQDQIKILDALWKTSFEYWGELMDNGLFWNLFSDRIRPLDDPVFSTAFVRRFRMNFPLAFDSINTDFATEYAKKGEYDRASMHVRFMQDIHQELDNTDQMLQAITKPLSLRINLAIHQVTGNLRNDREDDVNRAKWLLDATGAPLEAMTTLLGRDHAEVKKAGDAIAEAFLTYMIIYGNETNDWGTCLYFLGKGHQLASSKALRERYAQSKAEARYGYENQQLHEICWFCKKNRAVNRCKKEVAIHQLPNNFLLLSSGADKWRHVKVPVPRCSLCKIKHMFMHFWFAGALLGGAIGIFHASPLNVIIGASVGACIGRIIDLKFNIIHRDCYEFPVLREMLAHGWRKGGQPWAAGSSSIPLSLTLRGFLMLCGCLVIAGIVIFQALGGIEIGRSSSSTSSLKSQFSSYSQKSNSSSF